MLVLLLAATIDVANAEAIEFERDDFKKLAMKSFDERTCGRGRSLRLPYDESKSTRSALFEAGARADGEG